MHENNCRKHTMNENWLKFITCLFKFKKKNNIVNTTFFHKYLVKVVRVAQGCDEFFRRKREAVSSKGSFHAFLF